MKTVHKCFRILCVIAGIIAFSATASAWGQKGHDVTCTIAERHLTKKAKKEIAKVLDGKSIVYWANWLDNASHTPQFAYTKSWHFKNIDANETFESAILNESGDVLVAVNSLVDSLKSGNLSHEREALSLRMLVHLIGDMHCPMHMGHRSDLGGNRWQVQYFNKGTNLHSIWDSGIIEDGHKWTHTEWADEIDNVDKATAAAIASGTPSDWSKETYEVCKGVYAATKVGAKLSYDYVAEWTPVVEQQLLRAGLRLASLLNEIYR